MACCTGAQSSRSQKRTEFYLPPSSTDAHATGCEPCKYCPAPQCVTTISPPPPKNSMLIPHPGPPICPATCCSKCPSNTCPPPSCKPCPPLLNNLPCSISEFCPYRPCPSTKHCSPIKVHTCEIIQNPAVVKLGRPKVLVSVPNMCCTPCCSNYQSIICSPCMPCGQIRRS